VQRNGSLTVAFQVQNLPRDRQKDGVPEFPFSSPCSI
jgi:hypothetical protein